MPKPLALEAAQRVRHILPHTEVVESGNDPFREGWSVKSRIRVEVGITFPCLLPSDPVHLSHAKGLKKFRRSSSVSVAKSSWFTTPLLRFKVG